MKLTVEEMIRQREGELARALAMARFPGRDRYINEIKNALEGLRRRENKENRGGDTGGEKGNDSN